MSMPKEWTDKIKAQEQQKKLEADKIHNLPEEFEHQQQEQQQKQQKHTDKEPMLNVGEKILWKNIIKRGFWHRHVEWILAITTQGIVMEEGVNGHMTRLPYSELYDVVVTNQHSTGTGYHYTMRTGMYHSPMANYWGMNQWTGQQIGDVIFLDKNGNARMTWNNMVSPHGIQQLAKAEMKRFHK
jgi:hypothetical protein